MHDGTIGRRYGAVFGVIGTDGKLFSLGFFLTDFFSFYLRELIDSQSDMGFERSFATFAN